MNQQSNLKIAVMDIDGTLLKGQVQQKIINYLFKRHQISTIYYFRLNLWFILYKLGLSNDIKSIYEFGVRYFAGKDRSEVDTYLSQFIETDLSVSIFPKSFELIETLKREGYQIILLSAASDPIVSKLCKLFQANDYICTKLECINNKYTGKIDGEIVYGKNKSVIISKYFSKLGYLFENSVGYADHETDLPVLKLMGKGYIVNPDTHMLRIANREGLGIIETR